MADHYAEATRLIVPFGKEFYEGDIDGMHAAIARAQVHATLALVDAVRGNLEAGKSLVARVEEIAAGCTCTPTTGTQADCPVHRPPRCSCTYNRCDRGHCRRHDACQDCGECQCSCVHVVRTGDADQA